MFQSISWADFLSVIGIIILGYYTILGLILYGSEIAEFFKQRMQGSAASENSNQSKSFSDDLMGSAKPDSFGGPVSREVSVSAEDLRVVSDEAGESVEIISTGETRLLEQQNLLEEVQTLLSVVSPANQDEAASLYRALLERYTHLNDTVYRDHVCVIIHDGCRQRDLNFSLQEVQSWWPPL